MTPETQAAPTTEEPAVNEAPVPEPVCACESCPAAGIDLAEVDAIVERLGRQADALIPILQAIQKRYRYLPLEALRRVSEITDISPATIEGVSTFYSKFRHQPVGKHVISVCHGTACHVKGAGLVTDAVRRHLKLEGDADTTEDRLFTLGRVDCLGCCTLAPVVQIDGITYGHVTPDGVPDMLSDFLRDVDRAEKRLTLLPGQSPAEGMAEIRIGVGSCCIAGGSMDVRTALEEAVRELQAPVVVKPVGCVGMCHQTPLVEVHVPGQQPTTYAKMRAADARGVVRRHFQPKALAPKVRSLVTEALDQILTDEAWEPVTRYSIDTRDGPVCAFLARRSTSPPNCTASPTHWISTTTWRTMDSRPYARA